MTLDPILKTKLFIPPLREGFIKRPRLIDLMNDQVKHKVSFISAPAGFGKSTLLAEWAAQSERPVCWVSLDHDENDPVNFLSYLIAGVQTIWEDLGDATLSALRSPGSPSVEYLLTTWLNEIVEHTSEFVLILDDFHHIHNQAVIEMICSLPDRQPPQLHLVIASRADLPLSCSRLRAQGDLNELGIEDLRFTLDESLAFLSHQLGEVISEHDAITLSERTEGWIVGLHMAVLSMKASEDVSQYVAEFSAQNRYVADYLMDEVLLRQPEETQNFLLATSILDKFNAPLCNHVVGIDNSQEVIQTLERSGLFTIPLDTTRNWHRYHHLFAELLQNRLDESQTHDRVSFHRKASDWFAENGMLEESIAHAFAIDDYSLVISLIENSLNQIVSQGMFRNYLAWVDRIPKEYLQEKPRLEIVKVFMLHEMGKLNERDVQLALVDTLTKPLPKDLSQASSEEIANHGILASIKAIIYASSHFMIKETHQYAQLTDQLLTEEHMYWRTLASGALPFLNRALGKYDELIEGFSKDLEIILDSGFFFQACIFYSVLTKAYLEIGQLKLGIITCQKALDIDANLNLPFAKLAYLLMGEAMYQSGQLDAAEFNVERGLEHVIRHGDAYSIIDGYSTLARIQIAKGDNDQALSLMRELELVLGQISLSDNAKKIYDAWKAYILILNGLWEQAEEWTEQPGFNQLEDKYLPELESHSYVGIYRVSQTPIVFYLDFFRLTHARLLLSKGRLDEALAVIEKLLRDMARGGRLKYTVESLIVKSIILYRLDNTNKAIDSIQEAVHHGAKEGYVQVFLNDGENLIPLLEDVKEVGLVDIEEQVFILRLLEDIQVEKQRKKIHPNDDLVQLTPREIEVLECLVSGKSYSQAAEHLSISINTLKTHTRRIYQKLGVNGLMQALNKAKTLNIIN